MGTHEHTYTHMYTRTRARTHTHTRTHAHTHLGSKPRWPLDTAAAFCTPRPRKNSPVCGSQVTQDILRHLEKTFRGWDVTGQEAGIERKPDRPGDARKEESCFSTTRLRPDRLEGASSRRAVDMRMQAEPTRPFARTRDRRRINSTTTAQRPDLHKLIAILPRDMRRRQGPGCPP